ARERQQEHERHGGERVDRVVEHLRERARPEELERETERTGGRGDGGEAGRRARGVRLGRDGTRPLRDEERREAAGGARRGGEGVARRNADRRGQPESRRGDAERAAERVEA